MGSLYPIMSFTSRRESVVWRRFSISPNLELVNLPFRIACLNALPDYSQVAASIAALLY